MGGAGSKPGHRPTPHFNILKGRRRVTAPNNTQDTTLRSLYKRPEGEETNSTQNDQQPHGNEANNVEKINNSSEEKPSDSKQSTTSTILSELTSADTAKFAHDVETNSLMNNALFYECKDNSKILSQCSSSHVQESNSRCQLLHFVEHNTRFGSPINMVTSFGALDACISDHNVLQTVQKSNTKMKSQSDGSKSSEVCPRRHPIETMKPKERSNTAMHSVSSNSIASNPRRQRVRSVRCKGRKKPLPKSVSFSTFEKSPYVPVKQNRSLKLPTKSVTFNLSNTSCAGSVPSKRRLKPVGVASSGVLQRRNSLPGANQPQPLKSCLKLPSQQDVDTISQKPVRSSTGPLNKHEAKEWVGYYKKYLDTMKILPDWAIPSLHGTECIRGPDAFGGMRFHDSLDTPVIHGYSRGTPEYRMFWNNQWRNRTKVRNVRERQVPLWLLHSNARAASERSSQTNVSNSDSSPSTTSDSRSASLECKSGQTSTKSSQHNALLKRNSSSRSTRENRKLENEHPVGTCVVVEMDENGYTIKRSEGERSVDVCSLGKNWRALKARPTNIMDALMRQKVEWDRKGRNKKLTKRDWQRDEHSGKWHRKEQGDKHRKNDRKRHFSHEEDGADRRHGRKERQTEVYKDAKDGHREHRDRHKHKHRERHRSRQVRRRVSYYESGRDVSRAQKGHGEGLREDYNKDIEDYREDRKKIQGHNRKMTKEDPEDSHRKPRRENSSDVRSDVHYRRHRHSHGEDYREEQREKHQYVRAERHDVIRVSGHKRHKAKESSHLHGKERNERYLEDKIRHQIESMSKKSKKEGGNSETSDSSDASKASVEVLTKDPRNTKRKNHRKNSISRKKIIEDK